MVEFAFSGCRKTDNGGRVYFPMFRVLKSGLSDSRLARLRDIVKEMERGGNVLAKQTNGERTTENMACMMETVEKVTVPK